MFQSSILKLPLIFGCLVSNCEQNPNSWMNVINHDKMNQKYPLITNEGLENYSIHPIRTSRKPKLLWWKAQIDYCCIENKIEAIEKAKSRKKRQKKKKERQICQQTKKEKLKKKRENHN